MCFHAELLHLLRGAPLTLGSNLIVILIEDDQKLVVGGNRMFRVLPGRGNYVWSLNVRAGTPGNPINYNEKGRC
jgi:hypothetical protein